MKRWLILLLLLAGATGVYFLVGSGADDRLAPGDSGVASGDDPEVVAPTTNDPAATGSPVREVVGDDGGTATEPRTSGKPNSAPTIEGARIEGRVTDGLGRPLSEIVVSLLALEGVLVRVPRDLERTTTTAFDGTFAFGDLPATVGLVVRAEAPGLARAEIEVTPPGSGETRGGIELRLDPAITLSGIVTEKSGKPIAGASVVAELARSNFTPTPDSAFSARTDDRGAYAIPGLARTLYRVTARADGFVATTTEKTLLAVTLRPEAKLDLELDPAVGRASGRVVGDDELYVAGARVRAVAEGHEVETISEADGRFTLEGLADRSYLATARAPQTFPRESVALRPGDSDVVLRVGANGSLAGFARSPGGGAPSRIVVELFAIERTESLVARGVFPSASFRFDDLAPGRYRVAIECDGARRTESDPAVVESGTESDLGDVALRTGGTVVANVDGAPDGTPVSLVLGDVSGANPTWNQRAIFAPTAQRTLIQGGVARFEHVAPGTYTLFVVPEKGLPSTTQGVLVADDETTTVRATVVAGGASIRGRALDVLGVVIAARTAIATGPSGESKVLTDESGYFAFLALEPGDWTVTLEDGPQHRGTPRPVRVRLAEGESLEIELRVDP